MGHYRFRRSVKILPGVRVNFNLKSTSITFGGRGYKKTISTNGKLTKTIGIPETGISYTEVSKPSKTVKEDTEKILKGFNVAAKILLGSIGVLFILILIIGIVQV